MKYLKIQNKGELDSRLISLMGGTTKTGNSLKIGKFGTGLKYTLAYLIRNNIDFKIFVGEKEVNITTQTEIIQGTSFEIIYIDGERSSITTMMGLDWKGWMIVREIYCNALDEGLVEKSVTETLGGEIGTTTFYLQAAGEILDTINKWSIYFLDSLPLMSTNSFAIYPPSEHMRLYKNGVLIHENPKQKTVFSYDIKNASINELREYTGWANMDIVYAIKEFDARHAEIFLHSVDESHYEASMDYTYGLKFGAEWKKAIGEAKIISKKDYDVFVAKGVDVDVSKLVFVPNSMFGMLVHEFPGISSVRCSEKVGSFHEIFDAQAEMKIKTVLGILEQCNYNVREELKFIYGYFGDPSVKASINMDTQIVMISAEVSRLSLFEVMAIIVEENEHFVSGYGDLSRQFQQHFINLFVKNTLEKSEIEL